MLERVKDIAGLIRDFGVIIGIPAIISVGMSLYDIQSKAIEQQMKANEAHIKALESQNAFLKETQFDRAVAIIKSQKEAYELDKTNLENKISELKKSGDERVAFLEEKLQKTNLKVESSDELLQALQGIMKTIPSPPAPSISIK